MNKNEDNDIKIFGAENPRADTDVADVLENMNKNRQNGNFEKARQLGIWLAGEVMNDFAFENKVLSSADNDLRGRALMLFSAEAALNYYLPSAELSSVAVNLLNEKLIRSDSKLYDDVMESSDFSFYYVNVRKGGSNIPHDIGVTFAMLCRHDDEPEYIAAGAGIYSDTLDKTEKKIIEYQFAN